MTTRTDSGRVMTQSELIARDLQKILGGYAVVMDEEYMKLLIVYIMESRNEDYFNGEKVGKVHGYAMGVNQGRKEAGVMFLSAFDAELNKVLDGALPAWADETLDMAKRAVAAMSNSPDKQPCFFCKTHVPHSEDMHKRSLQGDEQTETDELASILLNYHEEKGEAYSHKAKADIEAWSRQQTAQILDKLANVETHAAQDDEFSQGYAAGFKAFRDDVEALRVGLEGKHGDSK